MGRDLVVTGVIISVPTAECMTWHLCCLDVSADDSLTEEVGAHSSSATGDVGLLECSDQQTQTSSSFYFVTGHRLVHSPEVYM